MDVRNSELGCRICSRTDQATWKDSETGSQRTAASPAGSRFCPEPDSATNSVEASDGLEQPIRASFVDQTCTFSSSAFTPEARSGLATSRAIRSPHVCRPGYGHRWISTSGSQIIVQSIHSIGRGICSVARDFVLKLRPLKIVFRID